MEKVLQPRGLAHNNKFVLKFAISKKGIINSWADHSHLNG